MALSSDGKCLAVGTHAGVTIANPKTAKVLQTLPGSWLPLRFDQSGTLLLASKSETAQWQSGKAPVSVKSLPRSIRYVLAPRMALLSDW